MTAVTVSYTSIADSAVDADSPVTEALVTALRDNAQFVYEWLGITYAGGAVQDHNHDGVNSALLTIGPNALRNGSFEQDETNWTFTDYTGGSHAQESANDMHGAYTMAFTSTVLANGGGYALSNEFIPCSEDDALPWVAHLKASTANVSARMEVIWYDDAQSQISATNLIDVTNAPTSATQYSGLVSAVATARFFKIRITGGVPAAGSATGTVYFDGLRISNVPLSDDSVTQATIAASAVGQGELKTTTGSVSNATTTPTVLTLPGGTYGFYPQTQNSSAGADSDVVIVNNLLTASYVTNITLSRPSAGTVAAQQRYIQASPPYDLGNGAVPLFVFADIAGGVIASTYVAEDPPWANNGPTDIRPDFTRNGKAYKRVPRTPIDRRKLNDPAQRDAFLEALRNPQFDLVEVDQALKQADMPLIPHPFRTQHGTQVLLDPAGALAAQLAELARGGESIGELLHDGYLNIDNTAMAGVNAPPGVLPVRANWKNNH